MLEKSDPIREFEPLWDGWKIDSFIGEGSYGRVYKAIKQTRERRYINAVKHIRVPKTQTELIEARQLGLDDASLYSYYEDMSSLILKEVDIMFLLKGEPNIVGYRDYLVVHEKGIPQWDIFIRMEYLETLTAYMERTALSEAKIVLLGTELCDALSACKRHNILHRDVKESNILVDKNGTFKLGDFGIAREASERSRSMSMRGTPAYIAPEIALGKRYGSTVDIYSLGILLYKLLNYGRYPFMPPAPQTIRFEDTDKSLERRLSGEQLPRPAIGSEHLQAAVLKACSYQPSERFQTPEEFKAALLGEMPARMMEPAFGRGHIVATSHISSGGSAGGDSQRQGTRTLLSSGLAHSDAPAAPASRTLTSGPTIGGAQQREIRTSLPTGLTSKEHAADAKPSAFLGASAAGDALCQGTRTPLSYEERFASTEYAGRTRTISQEATLHRREGTGNQLERIRKQKTKKRYRRIRTFVAALAACVVIAAIVFAANSIASKNFQRQRLLASNGLQTTPIDSENVSTNNLKLQEDAVLNAQDSGSSTGAAADMNVLSEEQQTQSPLPTSAPTPTIGNWSVWGTTQYTATDTREVESRDEFRYRDKQTKQTTEASLPGWTFDYSESNWGEFGGWSAWSVSSALASESREVETATQYSFRDTEYTESASSSMSGWTQYDSKTTTGDWGSWQSDPISESSTLQVESRVVYHYYRYRCANCGLYYPFRDRECPDCSSIIPRDSYEGIWKTTAYKDSGSSVSTASTNKRVTYNFGSEPWFFSAGNLNDTKPGTNDAGTSGTGGEVISQQYHSRTVSTIYKYSRTGGWSEYSNTVATPGTTSNGNTREVRTQTVYRYRDRTKTTVHNYYRYSEWSEWAPAEVSENDSRQTEKRTVYRYRDTR